MAAGKYDFTIEQGTTFSQSFVWKDNVGEPIVLTGFTARMQIRASIDSVTITKELTTENDGIVIDGPNGKITLVITATETAALSWDDTQVYDLEVVSAGGAVTRLLKGTVSLDKEVTR